MENSKRVVFSLADSQLQVKLQFSYFYEFRMLTQVRFIGQKPNLNFCPPYGLTINLFELHLNKIKGRGIIGYVSYHPVKEEGTK